MYHATCVTAPILLVSSYAAVASTLGAGPIAYDDQFRTVDVNARMADWSSGELLSHPLFQESDATPALGLFDGLVTGDASESGFLTHAEATQSSHLLPLAIIGSGSATAGVSGDIPMAWAEAHADSLLDATFLVTERVPFQFYASFDVTEPLELAYPFDTGAFISLIRLPPQQGCDYVLFSAMVDNGDPRFFSTGVLEPGRYQLVADAFASATSEVLRFSELDEHGGTASYDFRLTLPEPATAALLAAGGLIFLRRRTNEFEGEPSPDGVSA